MIRRPSPASALPRRSPHRPLDAYRRADRGLSLVTDDPDVRAAVLAAGRAGGVDVSPWPRSMAGRAWAASASLVLGHDAVDEARGLARAGRGPERVMVAAVGGHAAPEGGGPGVPLVTLPSGGADLAAWLLAASPPGPPSLVAVVGGRGGAGASTAAVALGRAAARAHGAAALVDADPLGGGLDLALGLEGAQGVRWGDLTGPSAGPPDPGWLLAALPRDGGLSLLSHGRGGESTGGAHALGGVLDALAGSVPLTVVDLPRHASPLVDAAVLRCALLVVVVPAEVRACAAAAAVVAAIGAPVGDVRLLVRGPAPSGLAAEDVAEAVGVPVFAEVRAESGLAAALEHGEAVGVATRSPLRRWADSMVASIGASAGPA